MKSSQKNTYVGVYFLIKMKVAYSFITKKTPAQVLLVNLNFFKNTYFEQ